MKHLCFLVINILLIGTAISQNKFIPVNNDSLFFNAQYQLIEANFKASIASLSGDNKKYLTDIYKERFDAIKAYFIEKKLYSNTEAEVYLQSLLNEIVTNNHILQQAPIYIFFNTTEVPNAASIGERMLVFNTGLFRRLENESQVAFVLSHELSHLLLNHNNKQINNYVETLYSKEFQTELKKVKNAEYQKRTQFEKLTKGFSFSNRRHSRFRESEADSMAIVLLSKTKFDATESIKTLQILDSVDTDNFNTDAILANSFNSESYPFKKRWLEKEDGLLSGHAILENDKKLEDSLKTHPDCSSRIKNITSQLIGVNATSKTKNIINDSYFKILQHNLQLDNLQNYYNQKNYDLVLYYSLKSLSKNNNSSFTTTIIGKTLNGIFDAQKNHTLSKFVSSPSPGNNESYNNLLQFIQNLYLDEIANINLGFLKKYELEFATDSDFKKILTDCRKKVAASL